MNKAEARMIEAISKDKLVGRGTCSYANECYDDEELLEVLRERKITTQRKAVSEWRSIEKILRGHDEELAARAEYDSYCWREGIRGI